VELAPILYVPVFAAVAELQSSLSAVAASVLNTLTSPRVPEYDWLDPTCSLSSLQKWGDFLFRQAKIL